jgi:hypothetical protein
VKIKPPFGSGITGSITVMPFGWKCVKNEKIKQGDSVK